MRYPIFWVLFFENLLILFCNFKFEALENGVSQFPKLDGRFPQVAGIMFFYDPAQPSGKRIKPESIKIQNQTIDLKQVLELSL